MSEHKQAPMRQTRAAAEPPRDCVFPRVRWEDLSAWVSFAETPAAAEAVVVFARAPAGFVLADIVGRGWCVPSGRILPGEAPEAAAVRETREEAGGALLRPFSLGSFRFETDSGGVHFVAAWAGWFKDEARPLEADSRGVRVTPIDALPAVYYRWDPLLAAVFACAEERLRDSAGPFQEAG